MKSLGALRHVHMHRPGSGGWDRTRRALAGIAAAVLSFAAGYSWASASPQSSPQSSSAARIEPGASVGPSTNEPRRVDNMPAGFARDRDGARAAAVALTSDVEQQMLYLDDAAIERAQRQISARERFALLLGERRQRTRQWRDILDAGHGQLWWIVKPLAVHTDTFTPDRSQVSVWMSYLVSRSGAVAPRVWFGVVTVDLVWERDDWRVWSQTLAEGPTASTAPGTKPTDAGSLTSRLEGFEILPGRRS